MMRLIIDGFVIVVALLSWSSAAPAQVSAAAIDSLFSKFTSAHDPGCAVLVIKDGQPVFRKGYGVTDLRTLQKIGPENELSAGVTHEAIHSYCGDAAGSRWQAALRRPPRRCFSRLSHLWEDDYDPRVAEPHFWTRRLRRHHGEAVRRYSR
jgi:hypothetical protein